MATTVAVAVLALQATALALEVKALYDYTQDGDEEALFKDVALGFLFLGAGKVLEKGAKFLMATRTGEKAMKVVGEVAEAVEDLPILKFSRKKMPNIADNIDEAFEAGQPKVLARETNKKAIKANRGNALDGVEPAQPGNSLDEYPFASAKEGGAGANVKSVPVKEQNIQGGTMSSFYKKNNIQDGDKFIVEIID